MLFSHSYLRLFKMDHSMHTGMEHGDMGHGGMGHGDMDMGGKCNMNVRYSLRSTLISY